MDWVDDEALGGDAALAVILKRAVTAVLTREFEVGVVEHDERVRAAQFEHAFLQRRSGGQATATPARSEPVSVTAEMRASAMRASTSSLVTSSVVKSPSGAPASRKTRSISSAHAWYCRRV